MPLYLVMHLCTTNIILTHSIVPLEITSFWRSIFLSQRCCTKFVYTVNLQKIYAMVKPHLRASKCNNQLTVRSHRTYTRSR